MSSVRPKTDPFTNYSGYYIANALQSSNTVTFPHSDNSTKRREMMNKTELLSIFYGSPEKIDYGFLKEYTDNVYPFGCRSTKTCQWMKEHKIKSYYSACLTLLSTYEGGKLSLGNTNPSHNAMTIVEHTVNTSNVLRELRQKKDLILIVDVIDEGVIPQEVRNKARRLSADIPKGYPHDVLPYVEKIRYCYRLLSQYKNYAKVVITSRIHVGLPAAALGAPVIFVSKVSSFDCCFDLSW